MISKGEFGGKIIFTGTRSGARTAQKSLVLPAHVASRTLPHGLSPNLSANELRSCSGPDVICIQPAGCQKGHKSNIQALHTLQWDVHLAEVKYFDDTLSEKQLARATGQGM